MDVLDRIADCVLAGDPERKIGELVQEALGQNIDGIDVLEKGLRKGIEIVGERFERMELFLPEMVKAADAMVAGVNILRPHFKKAKGENSMEKAGTVVIGTVHHDAHDIGKNIVSTFLEVLGFEVYDLGTDVSADTFVENAEAKGADIIAISALLSTTAPYMKDVIKELKRRGIRDKYSVMIGGGVVSQEYADQIGADGYGRDFSAAVKVAKELIGIRR